MPPAPPTPETLIGGYFVIVWLSFMLYGIFVAQSYEYSLHAREDPKLLRYTVFAVTILETVHTIFMVHSTYLYGVLDYTHPQGLAEIPWSGGASVAVGMIITLLVQGFYIRRIWVLSKRNWILTIFVSFLLLCRTPFNFASAGMFYTLKTWDAFRANEGPLITVCFGLSLSAGVDIIIASLLIFYLFRARTGFATTDHLVHTLAAYAVNSGFITMCCTTVSLITFFVMPESLVFAGLVQMSSKLYANSFLGTLNARRRLRRQAAAHGYATSGKINRSTTLAPSSNGMTTDPGSPRQIQIYQETFKVASTDDQTISALSTQKGLESMMEEQPVEMTKFKHVL